MSLPKLSILLIEDDEDDYILTQDCLESLSHWQVDITWVDNVEKGLEHIQTSDYDLCLLDYHLGPMTGVQLLQQIDIQQAPPVVILTGQSDSDTDQAAMDAGATDYLLKTELDSPRFGRSIRYALARRDMEKERLQRLKLESENRAKDRFLAHLSHELRTPLSSILGYTELLINRPIAEQAYTELSSILRNGRHLLSLLNDVLDLSKIAVDKLEINQAKTSLQALLTETLTITQPLAHEKNLDLVINTIGALPTHITTDATRFRQILINLIGNAIKFTEQGQVTIEVTFVAEHQQLCISIIDTGVGISDEHIQRIFRPFEQVEDMLTKNRDGSGLGLAICAELAQRMNGSLAVVSKLHQGSTFTLTLTLCSEDSDSLSPFDIDNHGTTRQPTSTPQLSGKVMVVEDVQDLRDLMVNQISQTGAAVVSAKNGQQALTLVSQTLEQPPFQLVFLDLHMPVMDGYQSIGKLRQYLPDTPILALTAATLKGQTQRLLELGFTDVLAKPMEHRMLHTVLQRYLSTEQSAQTSPPSRDETSLIVLVEDDADAATATQKVLEMLGANVVIANSGKACLQHLQSHHKGAHVLMDLGLPDMSGEQLIQDIREDYPDLPISILSGSSVTAKDQQNWRISHVLQKPAFVSHLKDWLENA